MEAYSITSRFNSLNVQNIHQCHLQFFCICAFYIFIFYVNIVISSLSVTINLNSYDTVPLIFPLFFLEQDNNKLNNELCLYFLSLERLMVSGLKNTNMKLTVTGSEMLPGSQISASLSAP